MKEKTIIFILLVLLVSLATEGADSASPGIEKSQKTCSYLIEVETTCAVSAETTDHISVRFSDSAGNLIIAKHLKNPKLVHAPKTGMKKPYEGFGRCAIDMFEASGACMSGSICSLYLLFSDVSTRKRMVWIQLLSFATWWCDSSCCAVWMKISPLYLFAPSPLVQ